MYKGQKKSYLGIVGIFIFHGPQNEQFMFALKPDGHIKFKRYVTPKYKRNY